jgi:hypothetical protein
MLYATLTILFACICSVASTSSTRNNHDTEPKVFFLFLSYGAIHNSDIWNSFFARANPLHYRVFLHTKNYIHSAKNPITFNVTTIALTFSRYHNIHQPMNKLFAAALYNSKNEDDMFVSISADAIPVKSFANIRSILTTAPTSSSICISPTMQWLKANIPGKDMYILKHHQWIVLNKPDAVKCVRVAESFREMIHLVPTLQHDGTYKNKHPGSTEEMWFGTALYGLHDNSSHLNPFTVPMDVEQGTCRTYVYWRNYLPNSQFSSIISEGSNFTRQTCTLTTNRMLKALKASEKFLFTRKFVISTKVLMEDGAIVPLATAMLVHLAY